MLNKYKFFSLLYVICKIICLKASVIGERQQLRKIENVEKESEFGYVYAVSGPGELSLQ